MSNVKIEKPLSADSTGKGTLFSGLSGKMPKDTGIFIVMIGIALIFEILGWYLRDQSFLLNPNRLLLIVLQVAIIGIIAVGVTQVIITTGIDLSSGSLIALTAVVAASWRRPRTASRRCIRGCSICRRRSRSARGSGWASSAALSTAS